jgi:hypothetical protein
MKKYQIKCYYLTIITDEARPKGGGRQKVSVLSSVTDKESELEETESSHTHRIIMGKKKHKSDPFGMWSLPGPQDRSVVGGPFDVSSLMESVVMKDVEKNRLGEMLSRCRVLLPQLFFLISFYYVCPFQNSLNFLKLTQFFGELKEISFNF